MRVEQLADGRWRFSLPKAPGWAAAASNPGDAARAIRSAFTEAQVSAHAEWRGHVYDAELDGPGYRRHKPISRGKKRKDVYDPRMWRLAGDGRWVAPRGHRYAETTSCVQRVIAARLRLGLSARPDPRNPDLIPPLNEPTSLADMPPEEALQSLVASGG